ncbi:MAG: hypothetical protein ACXV2H_06915 [Actinomycetes bacterium]
MTGWTSRGEGAGQAYATVAYDSASGAQSWATLYNGLAKGYNEARSLAVSPSTGTVFVTGSADDAHATGGYRGGVFGPAARPRCRLVYVRSTLAKTSQASSDLAVTLNAM